MRAASGVLVLSFKNTFVAKYAGRLKVCRCADATKGSAIIKANAVRFFIVFSISGLVVR
jgi:hypothetical protein